MELPWQRNANPKLPDNKRIPLKSFESLKRKLNFNVSVFKRYIDVKEDYIQQGICDDVSMRRKRQRTRKLITYLTML